MSKRGVQSQKAGRIDLRMILSIVASVVMPPLGAWLVWNSGWSRRAQKCLSAVAMICFVLIIGALAWPGESHEGGIEYVERKPEVAVYGPESPSAAVSGYIAPVSRSVIADDEDENITYVYATPVGDSYHLAGCKYAYESAQKMTTYAAHFMGYTVCNRCNPPAYVPGSMN